jgi:ArsR family transcriptional regulator, lead/cadmium/zinc/bismuth-responsive transcriptional repressor
VDACDLLCLDVEAAERIRGALDRDAAATFARTLKLLGDPTRLLIAQALAEHELCGCDLAWITGASEKLVSHHLGKLRAAGLVASRREGKVVFASLTAPGRALLASLAEVRA